MSLLATNLESLNDDNLRKIYDILFYQDQSKDIIPFIETKGKKKKEKIIYAWLGDK